MYRNIYFHIVKCACFMHHSKFCLAVVVVYFAISRINWNKQTHATHVFATNPNKTREYIQVAVCIFTFIHATTTLMWAQCKRCNSHKARKMIKKSSSECNMQTLFFLLKEPKTQIDRMCWFRWLRCLIFFCFLLFCYIRL